MSLIRLVLLEFIDYYCSKAQVYWLLVDSLLLREINLDKLRGWKPFYKLRQHKTLASHFLLDKRSEKQTTSFSEFNGLEMVQIGYEVYADGPTRVLRFCEISKSHKRETVFQSCEKIQLRVPQFTINLFERGKQVSLNYMKCSVH